MTKFAYCDGGDTIRQFDSAAPATLPYPIHYGETNIRSLALATAKKFDMVWGPGGLQIAQTKTVNTDAPLYTHPLWLRYVRVRNVAGADRIYFSALQDKTSGIYGIYYLSGTKAVLYTTVNPAALPFPNPCVPGEVMTAYNGDFAFGDGDALYLSSGNVMGPKIGLKVGIYRITGAGPDSVTGSVQRIYLGDGPIEALCFVSPNVLYFLRMSEVYKLDLGTMTETLEGTIDTGGQNIRPRDIADAKDGFKAAWWWVDIALLIKWLTKTTQAFRRSAERWVIGPPAVKPSGRVTPS